MNVISENILLLQSIENNSDIYEMLNVWKIFSDHFCRCIYFNFIQSLFNQSLLYQSLLYQSSLYQLSVNTNYYHDTANFVYRTFA